MNATDTLAEDVEKVSVLHGHNHTKDLESSDPTIEVESDPLLVDELSLDDLIVEFLLDTFVEIDEILPLGTLPAFTSVDTTLLGEFIGEALSDLTIESMEMVNKT